jgi:S-formylglutathione hydrolase FrmB
MRPRITGCVALLAIGSLACAASSAMRGSVASTTGRVEEHRVHGAAIEGNPAGIPAERPVAVYLPPSYDRTTQRYPVVFVLHGIMDSHTVWTVPWQGAAGDQRFATMQGLMDAGIAAGTLREMILVMPDADKTCHYTDSPVKGGWGTFVARDLVAWVDRTYRTTATAAERGIMGHSMGGHGAIKLSMTHPGVFGTVYAMNPSLLGMAGDVSLDNARLSAASAVRSASDLERADFYTQAVIGVGQCFSPSVTAALRTDLPFTVDGAGRLQAGPGMSRWQAQLPLTMARQHTQDLHLLRGLRLDSALEDEFSHIPITTRAFSRLLDSLGIAHTFELYNGDHRKRLWGREGRLRTEVLPWFSRMLGEAVESPARVNAEPVGRAQSQLWRASQTGDLRMATAALRGGADVNALDTTLSRTGRRPLNYAAENNLATMITWLVERGAAVDRPNLSGFTPLHHAAEQGATDAARALLASGANPFVQLPSGSTPLRVARQRRHEGVAGLLEVAMRDSTRWQRR